MFFPARSPSSIEMKLNLNINDWFVAMIQEIVWYCFEITVKCEELKISGQPESPRKQIRSLDPWRSK